MMPRPSRFRLALILGGALVALLSIPFWIQHASVDSASSVIPLEVREQALRQGRIRVIAELRLPGGPHVPEGLLSAPALAVQRNDIASVRGQILARLAGRSSRLVRQYDSVPLVALEVGPDALTEIEASSTWVRSVVLDAINMPTLPQSVPLIGADQAWSQGYDGTGFVVAIVDTGVEASHPFLAGKVVEEACYSSTVSGQSITMCPNGQSQQIGPGAGAPCPLSNGCWHGTHVAGIAAGNGAGAGVTFSGVAKGAQIMAVQVFSKFTKSTDCGGSAPCALAWTSDIIAGLQRVYAVRGMQNLASANMSLGGGLYTSPCNSDPTKPAIDNLRSVGIATVVAAGNNGSTNALSSPGCVSSAISVGATTKSDVVASYSNMASFMSLLAPGSSITSSVTGGGFGGASGTSMATPHVTGTWAVLRQAAPGATLDQILAALQNRGLLITDTRSGGTVTKPRIRIDQALAALVPTVTSVTPNQGTVGKAVPVTINGTGFAAADTVSLSGSGISVSNVTLVSATQLTATFTIAAGAPVGSQDVSVTGTNGGTGTLPGGFSVTASSAMTVSSMAPAQGTQGAAVPVTITGSGFVAGATVTVSASGVAVGNVTVNSATQITATFTVANGAATGARDVTVTNPGGGTATLAGGFTVVAPVTIGSVVPNQGAQGSAVSVTIAGSGFASGASVAISGTGVTASSVSVSSATQITATFTVASNAATGARDITVTNSAGGSATLTGGFTVVAAVTIGSVNPNQGAQGAAVPITIAGSGFAAGATLTLSGTGVTASNVSVTSASQLTATLTVAAGAALGARDLTVTNSNGVGATLAGGFTVVTAGPASLSLVYNGKLRDRVGQGNTALAPDGALDGTLTATLSASGGRTITALRLDSNAPGIWDTDNGNIYWALGVAASLDGALLNSPSTMAINFAVTDGGSFILFAADYQGSEFLSGRTLTLTATFSDGSSIQASTTVPAAVTLTSVSPAQGTQGTAVPVTITGSGFAAGATVAVSGTGVAASNVSVTSASQLAATLTVAAGATLGARDVTVTNSSGTGAALAAAFTVVAPVSISSVAPAQAAQGITVQATITGSGFASGAGVTLGGTGVTVSNVSVASATQITATFAVASGAALGARDVTVTNTAGGGATLAGGFTIVAPVTVSSVTPNQGAQGANVPVTIVGSGFAAGATLTLSGTGVTASNVSVTSASQLTATLTVAAGAALGARDVTVTNSSGLGATLTGGFTIVSASPATLSLVYNGKLRDRVGQGNTALAPDGALDGTLTATLSASGGRTITALRLDSNAPGIWDTDNGNIYWALGVAASLDGALLNSPSTMAVNFPVTDGGSFVVFAADYQGGEFLSGRTLTVTATFSDGSSTQASTTLP